MVPSTADDTAAESAQEEAAPSQATEDSAAEARPDEASDQQPDEQPDEQSDEQSDDRIGEKEGESQLSSEPVDVAPNPEQTGIEVSKPPRLDDLSEDEVEEIRSERLDPDQRPDNVEVDNTQRDFDTTMGRFEDSDADPPGTAPFIDPEKPENQDDDAGDDDAGDDDPGDDAGDDEGTDQETKEDSDSAHD